MSSRQSLVKTNNRMQILGIINRKKKLVSITISTESIGKDDAMGNELTLKDLLDGQHQQLHRSNQRAARKKLR